MKIIIKEEKETESDIADLLRYIADEIDKGNNRGYTPNWEIDNEKKCIECGAEMPDNESGYCYKCNEKIK